MRFLAQIDFSLDQLRYEYPDELREGYATEQEALEAFAWEGARKRYPHGVPDAVAAAIRHELALVAELQYAAYFLTVHDIVRFARGRDILCQGRGSAANSAVCFCLGITEVDPTKHDLLFERFISAARREPPDIDVDFEHERREEVMQYIYARYGRERAGLTAAVVSYRGRSALREVGKVFGFDDATLGALSSTVWGGEGSGDAAARAGLDLDRCGRRPSRAPVAGDRGLSAPSLPAHRRLRHHPRAARRGRAHRQRRDGGPHHRRMGQGRSRRARHSQDRHSRAGHALVPAPRPRSSREPLRRAPHAREHPRRGAVRLRHDLPRRHDRRVPDRKPRADVDAAAPAARARSTISSSRSPSCGPARSRATWCIPICAAGRAWRRSPIHRRSWRRCSARRWACRCSRSRR